MSELADLPSFQVNFVKSNESIKTEYQKLPRAFFIKWRYAEISINKSKDIECYRKRDKGTKIYLSAT